MTIDLEAIKARCKAATKGPWTFVINRLYGDDSDPWVGAIGPEDSEICTAFAWGDPYHDWRTRRNDDKEQVEANAEFIAHACVDVPALVTEVERLRTALSKSIKQRQVEVGKTLMARSETEDAILKMYNDCQDEVERLQRELHDERIRCSEWEKMYNAAQHETAELAHSVHNHRCLGLADIILGVAEPQVEDGHAIEGWVLESLIVSSKGETR